MSVIPSLLRPLAVRCLAVVSLCSALVHAARGDLDPSFVAQSDYTLCIALQADGQAVVARQTSISRLGKNAAVDPFFNVSVNGDVRCMAIQPDGKILLGGNFSVISGISRNALARLLPDGSVDPGFNPSPDAAVNTIMVAEDGSVIVGGTFTEIAGETRNRVAKFTASGELDSFNPSLDAECKTLDIQADGRILLGGLFSTVNGMPRARIARVSTAGALDETFTPAPAGGVTWLAEQADGKILLNHIAPQTQGFSLLQRLETSGAVDPSFQTDLSPSALIYSTVLQADGKILIGGRFSHQNINYNFARLTSNGAFDPTFAHQGVQYIRTIAPTADGKVLIGGDFNHIKGATRNGIARLIADPVTSTLTLAGGDDLEWRREGTPAEFKRVTFESRTNGGEWIFLGHGQRMNDTWRLSDVSLPQNGIIRARGYLPASGHSSVHGEYLNLGTTVAVPEITQNGISVPAGGIYQQGKVLTGFLNTLDFQITNTGDRRMDQISLTQLAGCTVKIPPAVSLEPGETTRFQMEFRIQTVGPFTSSFSVASDSTVNPGYQIQITGLSSKEISPVFRTPSDVPVPGQGTMTTSHSFGQLTLEFAPAPGTVLVVVKLHAGSILPDLPEAGIVSAEFNGVTYRFLAGYRGGSPLARDLTLSLLGDGVLERLLNPYLDTPLTLLGDGSILYREMRLDAEGEVDPVYRTPAGTGTTVTLAHANGEAYAVNTYSTYSDFARLRNDGTRDPEFNAAATEVRQTAMQPDGKLIVVGSFASTGGAPGVVLARLNPDGSRDATFNPSINAQNIRSIALDGDGNIVVGGWDLSHPNGQDKTCLARFAPDGTRDLTFAPDARISEGFILQPDGKIVMFNNTIPAEPVRRFLPDGSVDPSFNLVTDGNLRTMALQADGKFLIAGNFFTHVGGHPARGIARINPDGSPDPSFFAKLSYGPDDLLISDKNQILIHGGFYTVNGVTTSSPAILRNPTAGTQVALANSNTVRWMRQGGAAELQWVKADLIRGDTGEVIPLGAAQRITGGWEITSLIPISNATVHLSGLANHSSGTRVMMEEFLEVGDVSPRMVVTKDDQIVSPGATQDLGRHLLGFTNSILMTITNHGAGTLEAPFATIEGPNASDFTLTQSSPVDLRTGERRSFRVNFKPGAIGIRTAQLVIRHSDPLEGIQVIPLRYEAYDTLDPIFNNADDVAFPEIGFDAGLLKLGTFTLGFAPPPRTVLKVYGRYRNWSITGALADLPGQSYITANYNGITYTFLANYGTENGNDLTLRLVGVGDTIPGFAPAANGTGAGLAIQPDGKVLVGGLFNTIGGVPSQRLARLHPDGRADLSFSATVGSRTDSMVIQDDGRILIGGIFSTVHGVSRPGIARLEPDGSLDTSFDLRAANSARPRVDTNRLLKLRNGKVIVGGQFTSLSGVPKQNIARLNADGSLDETFTTAITGTTPDTAVLYSMHEQPDGKLLIGGRFTTVNGVPRFGFARLNADGTLDTSLADLAIGPNPGPVPNGTETRVSAIVTQPDGKILFGGEFTTVLGHPRTRFARLNADGTLDTSFSPSANNTVSSLALQEDGRILAAGLFTQVSGQARTRVVRLGTDGSLDPEFQPEVDGTVTTLVMDRHGKVWVTGEFTTVSGLATRGISKLENNGPGLSLSIANGTTALWSAGASAPVLREVAFELSTDGGATWSPLGNATKVIGGWSLENLTLPAHGYLRAKGYGIASNRTSSEIEETLLFGRALTKIEQWRADTFGSPTNQRTGADLNDADKDGVANLMEYAFGLDPEDTASSEVPTWYHDGSQFELSFLPPPGIEGVTYGAEWSSSMNPSDWHDVPNQGTGGDQRFVVPKDAPFKFMRMKVTNMGSVPPP